MRRNRIERYLNSSLEADVDVLFWSDFLEAMIKGGASVRGTVRLDVSKKGAYKLNIILYPDRG